MKHSPLRRKYEAHEVAERNREEQRGTERRTMRLGHLAKEKGREHLRGNRGHAFVHITSPCDFQVSFVSISQCGTHASQSSDVFNAVTIDLAEILAWPIKCDRITSHHDLTAVRARHGECIALR